MLKSQALSCSPKALPRESQPTTPGPHSTDSTRRLFSYFWQILAVSILAVVSGCQTGAHVPAERLHPQRLDQLSAGDVLKVNYPGLPELNQLQKIRPDGKVALPDLGDVVAAGKTVPQFRANLVERYSQLKNPNVIVSIESNAKCVYVSGAVGKGGPVILDHPMTVDEVIAAAGGLRQDAYRRGAQLRCLENGRNHTYSIDLRKTDEAPVYVRPFDEISVPTL